MGTNELGPKLVEGMTLYDVDTKSIGILVRRFSTKEFHGGVHIKHTAVPYGLWELDMYDTWAWESLWSKDGRVVYSEDGLLNLVKAGIIVIVDDNKEVP
jgi:hypothetical protein